MDQFATVTERIEAGRETELVDLLGEPRATIVRILKRDGERSAPELAEALGITDVAVRRHLAILTEDGFITDRTVKQERGRPVARHRLTERGEDLFPHRYEEMVDELIAFITDRLGSQGLRAFLRWRQDKETATYSAAVDGEDIAVRLDQLAEALSEAGFAAEVRETDDGFELTQTHCAVYEVAKEHPEMCAHEAAMFRRVLGDVTISRRETLASGADACVCSVSVPCDSA